MALEELGNYNLLRDFNCSNNKIPDINHLAKMTYISLIDASINVIKDIKPEYYKTAIEVANNNIIYPTNLFIMKKKDFIKIEFLYKIIPDFNTPDSFQPHGLYSHGILQARILEWVAFSFSRGSSQPRDRTQVFCSAGGFFTI